MEVQVKGRSRVCLLQLESVAINHGSCGLLTQRSCALKATMTAVSALYFVNGGSLTILFVKREKMDSLLCLSLFSIHAIYITPPAVNVYLHITIHLD